MILYKITEHSEDISVLYNTMGYRDFIQHHGTKYYRNNIDSVAVLYNTMSYHDCVQIMVYSIYTIPILL